MIDILIAVGIFLGVSVVCDVLLILADKYFAIKEDATVVAIRDCLPGANCGACGYSGCDGYAKALAEGKTVETNLCVPGGDGTACGIASILGLEAKDVVERVAYVSCNGTCDAAKQKYEYSGYNSCRIQNLFYSGEKLCPYACLGCGDCAAACPYGAIDLSRTVELDICGKVMPVAKIDYDLCRTCKNGACPSRFAPYAKPDRVAALCNRTCLCHLEETDALGNKFETPFRKKEPWVIGADSKAPSTFNDIVLGGKYHTKG